MRVISGRNHSRLRLIFRLPTSRARVLSLFEAVNKVQRAWNRLRITVRARHACLGLFSQPTHACLNVSLLARRPNTHRVSLTVMDSAGTRARRTVTGIPLVPRVISSRNHSPWEARRRLPKNRNARLPTHSHLTRRSRALRFNNHPSG